MAGASNKLAEAIDEIPIDPFAVDVFGTKESLRAVEETSPTNQNHVIEQAALGTQESNWHLNLPRVTKREAEFSDLLRSLPADLTKQAIEKFREAIARCTFRPAENISCSIVSVSEVDLNESIDHVSKSPSTFFTLRSKPEDAIAIIAINTAFASSLLDIVLEGKSSEFSNPRALSPIETTIIEFLAMKILGEINHWLEQPLLIFQEVKNEIDVAFDQSDRGIETALSVKIDSLTGIINLLATRGFLRSLDRAQNPLLARGDRSFEDFEKLVPKMNTRLLIGKTSLDSDSFSFLEPGDVLLIEQAEISFQNDWFCGDVQIYAGSGTNFLITGKIVEDRRIDDLPNQIVFEVSEIVSREEGRFFTPIRQVMNENENGLPESPQVDLAVESADEIKDSRDAMPASLENVQIGLRAEIAASRLSLQELRNLKSGQIIGLGCKPTDPVYLVADNNEHPIATGELVEIQGQLGIRLTRVFI